MNEETQLVRSPVAARQWLGIVPGTLRAWRVQGKGPRYTKIGGTVFYKRDDLVRFLAEHELSSTSDESVKKAA